MLPLLDRWLLKAFEPGRLLDTIAQLEAAQEHQMHTAKATFDPEAEILQACDEKLARYRAVLDGGGDAAVVMRWMREVTDERAAAQARQRAANHHVIAPPRQLKPELNPNHMIRLTEDLLLA